MLVTLNALQIKELAELVGFKVEDIAVSDWLPDDSTVTIIQHDEPLEVKDEDGYVCGYWKTVATFDEASENGAAPLGATEPTAH